MVRTRALAAGALAVLLLVGAYAWVGCGEAPAAEELLLHSGAGIKPPVEEVIAAFQRETGISVRANYGPSNMLLGNLKLREEGDLFLPGDDFYIEEAREADLVTEARSVAAFVPVIMVRQGNPLNIRSVQDLVGPEVRLAIADRRTAAVGRITGAIFEKNDISASRVEERVVYTSTTAPELGQAVTLGHADATIVWRPVALQYEAGTEVVEIEPERNVISPVAIGIIRTSRRPEAARRFVEFITSEFGREVFARHGYDVDDGG